MRSRVTSRGQVTIPKSLRERLGIKEGQVLDFDTEDGRLVATKSADRSPVDELYGTLRLPGGTDRFLRDLRGEAGSN
ncbi:MAG: AbrB/MazE/SpoVT family DNA-binding domain-containing protein [Solirubrobacteraceae bacterium]